MAKVSDIIIILLDFRVRIAFRAVNQWICGRKLPRRMTEPERWFCSLWYWLPKLQLSNTICLLDSGWALVVISRGHKYPFQLQLMSSHVKEITFIIDFISLFSFLQTSFLESYLAEVKAISDGGNEVTLISYEFWIAQT